MLTTFQKCIKSQSLILYLFMYVWIYIFGWNELNRNIEAEFSDFFLLKKNKLLLMNFLFFKYLLR